MSKRVVVKSERVKLKKHKVELPEGLKLAKPLEVTVSLVCERGNLHDVIIQGPLVPETRLTSMGDLGPVSEKYEDTIKRLRKGDYTLYPTFKVEVSVRY